MKKRNETICLIVYLVVVCLVTALIVSYNSCQTKKEVEEVFDKADQYMAITQLSELRGMILEVEALSHEDIPQDVLRDELESIKSSNFTNKYLDDFTFDIPITSNVGELCEEFISQIDNQIHTIKYGTKG